MAAITFKISRISGQKAEGTLSWPAKGLSSNAVSGPYGNGYLPFGIYAALRSKMLDKPGEPSYCDTVNNCWMQPIDPRFVTGRTDLGIHPDGGSAGTEGCIGIKDTDTKAWYDAFYGVAMGGRTDVEVIKATDFVEDIIAQL